MPTVIRIENLWKEYRLGVIGHGTLTHDLQSWWARLRGKEDPNSTVAGIAAKSQKQIEGDRFWALRDINLDVQEGDVVGIIGKNGAGKSTLLKILSRVTGPTVGSLKIKGRIASLLEVGTGFHPELTGRENIFLNGAILGMSKHEIRAKLDEIIEFSGVEQHVDTPVKRYSSGMHVRLAFSVAAHLEPEILVVDEVLAVGDVEFQKKCLGKMKEVSHAGRTVLFVSHNMAAVANLCTRGVLLENGTVTFCGNQEETINRYLHKQSTLAQKAFSDRPDRGGSGDIRISDINFVDDSGNQLEQVGCGQSFTVHLKYQRSRTISSPEKVHVSIMVKTLHDVPVFQHHNGLTGDVFNSIPEKGEFVLKLENFPLTPALYKLAFAILMDGEYLDHLQDALELRVEGGDFFGTGKFSPASHGLLSLPGKWDVAAAA